MFTNTLKNLFSLYFILGVVLMAGSSADGKDGFLEKVGIKSSIKVQPLIPADFTSFRPHHQPHGLRGTLMSRNLAVSPTGDRVAWGSMGHIFIARLAADSIRVERAYRMPDDKDSPYQFIWISDERIAIRLLEYAIVIIELLPDGGAAIVSRLSLDERIRDFAYENNTFVVSVGRLGALMLFHLDEKMAFQFMSHLGDGTAGHLGGDHNCLTFEGSKFFYALRAGHYTKRGNPWSHVRSYFYHPAVFGMYDASNPSKPRRLGDVVETTGISAVRSNGIEPIDSLVVGAGWLAVLGLEATKFFHYSPNGIGKEFTIPGLGDPVVQMFLHKADTLIVQTKLDFAYQVWRYSGDKFQRVATVNWELPQSAKFSTARSFLAIGNLVVVPSIWDDGYVAIDLSGPKPTMKRIMVIPLDLD